MTCWYYRLPGHLDTYGPVLGMWKTADDFQDHLRTLWGTALPTGLEIWKGGIRPTRVAVVQSSGVGVSRDLGPTGFDEDLGFEVPANFERENMTRQILDAFLSEQGQTWYLIGTFDGEQLVGLYKQGYFSEWSTGYSFQILWGEPDLSDLNNVIGALSHV